MHFTVSSIALLAVAAGVQAGSSHKQAEPPVNQKEGGAAVGTAGTAVQGTAAQTGTHPIVTGSGSSNGTSGGNGTASTIPVSVPTSTSGSGSGSGSAGSAGSGTASNTPASPSSTGFTPSNAGANVSPMGAAGALVGGAVYGLMLLA
ncbi:uncharacterized protein N7483_004119 [Penicillium malachiteum]|uniref:uncharacterized protein n=1 Tax=Penicillium malachiteum TaxID=1324776 RepID=UPI0025481F9C|nr:uncharacterized protein N7483_004119 [Penicillium malachiteum]KAJ5729611.1 hypothetical protein N7483_004119 [Penicillium malachiteum]